MATETKANGKQARFKPAIVAFVFCAFIAASGLGFVWQKRQINDLGRQLKEAEVRLDELRRQNKNRAETLQQFLSPRLLDQKAATMFPDLARPSVDQIFTLPEPQVRQRSNVEPTQAPVVPRAPQAAPASGPQQVARATNRAR
jgi:transposase